MQRVRLQFRTARALRFKEPQGKAQATGESISLHCSAKGCSSTLCIKDKCKVQKLHLPRSITSRTLSDAARMVQLLRCCAV
jgi:hypothetical protein